MEDVILVDENDNEIGTVSRNEAHLKGLPHRIAVIYLVNDKGQILIQERMSGRLDHSSAGHVDVGETYENAAYRELKEELGIKAKNLRLIGSGLSDEKNNSQNSHIVHRYQVFVIQAEPGRLQENEVKSVFWADPKQIFEDMKINPNKYSGGFKSSIQIFLDKYNF
jgi:isopentenyldiphosphate isomerase